MSFIATNQEDASKLRKIIRSKTANSRANFDIIRMSAEARFGPFSTLRPSSSVKATIL